MLLDCFLTLQYLENERQQALQEGDAEIIGGVEMEEIRDEEDISDYKFVKFATTYFQGKSY